MHNASAVKCPGTVAVARHDERLKIQRDGAAEWSRLEAIAAEIERKRMLPFVGSPPQQFADGPHLSGHPGFGAGGDQCRRTTAITYALP